MPRTIFTKPYMALTQALIDARNEAGLRQEDVASRLNKHQSFVSKVERGERRLDVVEFLVFVRAINADPAGILADVLSQIGDDFPL